MKLWISGQGEAEIGDAFRHIMNEMEKLVNDKIEKSEYGNGLTVWGIIFIILEKDAQESFKYDKKTTTSDIRINLNYQNFKRLDSLERKKIFIDGLIRSLDELRGIGVFGATRQLQYKIGDKIMWGFNEIGKPDLTKVKVYGVLGDDLCPICNNKNQNEEFDIYIEKDIITAINKIENSKEFFLNDGHYKIITE
jgi:Immunity protein 44